MSTHILFSGPKNFVVEIENYKLDYLQDDLRNEDSIFINQAPPWPNDLAQSVDNFVLSSEDRNLLDRTETNNVYEFNLNSQEPLPWQSLTSRYDIQPNGVLKWNIPKIK